MKEGSCCSVYIYTIDLLVGQPIVLPRVVKKAALISYFYLYFRLKNMFLFFLNYLMQLKKFVHKITCDLFFEALYKKNLFYNTNDQ